jgi:anti-anti-sigma regulatory factor
MAHDSPFLAHREPAGTRSTRTFVRVADAATTIGVTGDLDAARTASFRAELRELSQVCAGRLIVDLSACVESTGLALADLVTVQATCSKRGCRLSVRAQHPEIENAISLAGIPLTNDRDDHLSPVTIPALASASA